MDKLNTNIIGVIWAMEFCNKNLFLGYLCILHLYKCTLLLNLKKINNCLKKKD